MPRRGILLTGWIEMASRMKRVFCISLLILVVIPTAEAADSAVFLNAFGETATAYLNDAFLLLGITADGYVANIVKEEAAAEIVTSVQKRVRVIRAKLQAVARCKIAEEDRQLINLLDKAYACMDHQAWALSQYVEEKSPQNANRFEEQRNDCLQHVDSIKRFYSSLPPRSQVSEPLSTR